MKTKLSLIAMIAISVIFTSCEGPEGPQGPAGAKGDTGAQGQPGAAGATGTANVIYSGWLNLPAKYTTRSASAKQYDLAAASITKEVIDNAAILAYGRETPTSLITLLSTAYSLSTTTNGITTITGTYESKVFLGVGQIRYAELWTFGGTVSRSWYDKEKPLFEQIRYVIIPGGTKARVKGLDYSNYEAVKAHYGLED
jgi:hypothetical protein